MEMLGLHNLKTVTGSKTAKKRRGRGNASGKGNYSGRGMKGQRARSGGKGGLKLRGVRGYLQRVPKSRGFNSLKVKRAEVNLSQLEAAFKAGEIVTPKIMVARGLIKSVKQGVKVLALGEIKKNLEIKANAFSKSAVRAIIKAGGKVGVIKKELKRPVKVRAKSSGKK